MSLNANHKKSASTKNRVPQPNLELGGHPARVVQVLDLGLQPRRPYKGQAKPPIDMVSVTYELSHDFMVDADGNPEEDRPRWISEEFPLYSLQADRAISTARYRAIDPKDSCKGDFSKLIGMPCTVVVVHNPGTKDGKSIVYDNVGTVTSATKMPGYTQPELVNEGVFFDLTDPNMEVFAKLPEFLQNKIKGNLNYQGSLLQKLLGEVPEEAPAPSSPNEDAPLDSEDDDNPY